MKGDSQKGISEKHMLEKRVSKNENLRKEYPDEEPGERARVQVPSGDAFL